MYSLTMAIVTTTTTTKSPTCQQAHRGFIHCSPIAKRQPVGTYRSCSVLSLFLADLFNKAPGVKMQDKCTGERTSTTLSERLARRGIKLMYDRQHLRQTSQCQHLEGARTLIIDWGFVLKKEPNKCRPTALIRYIVGLFSSLKGSKRGTQKSKTSVEVRV